MTVVFSEQLAKSALFEQCTSGELEELARRFRPRRYRKDRVIFGEGDPGADLFLVAAGRVSVGVNSSDGRFLALHVFGPGDVFGELALLDGGARSADAIAQEPCELMLLSRADFLRFLEGRPKVAIRLLRTLSLYIRRTNQRAAEIAFLPVPARLAQILLELAASRDSSPESRDLRTVHVTQVELAAWIGATRETVNRWLSFFEDQGLIRRQRGQVTIVRSEGLRDQVN
ncbi:MAG TPA: Crp/Fnr family transcriptional regulator [Chloroflexota bacterium]|nr:Crp/Fnr family transcriptional regulator [Chloroflexota bacterium]